MWCDLLFVEFFAQGDLEKMHHFPVSQFYDRETTNIAKSQIGFIDFIISPAFAPVIKVFPKLAHLNDAIEHNKSQWTKMFDTYEEELKSGNHQVEVVQRYLKYSKTSAVPRSNKKSMSQVADPKPKR